MRHLWSVICSKASVDQETKNVSLFEILESLQFVTPEPLTFPATLPIEALLVTVWMRDRLDVPEKGEMRVRLLNPAGVELLPAAVRPVDLETSSRARLLGRLGSLRGSGDGMHRFEISARASNRTNWNVIHEVPLELSFKVDTSITQSPVVNAAIAAPSKQRKRVQSRHKK